MSDLGAVFAGRVIDGRLTFDAMELARWRYALSSTPGNVEVVIRRPVKDRSHDQNAYYWGVVLKLISESSGHTPAEHHQIFKRTIIGGKNPTTKNMTTAEFQDYLEQIRAWAGEHNIIIPDPQHVDYQQ